MIPDYQSIMLPLLEFISDGKEYKMRFVTDELAIKFGVSEEEQKELLPSGVAPIFYTAYPLRSCNDFLFSIMSLRGTGAVLTDCCTSL